MKLPLQILFHDMERSDSLERSAREHAQKLESFSADIISCRITIELEQKRAQQGRPFSVRIDLTLPGHELLVNRVHNEDARVALHDAFDNMKRQLVEIVRSRKAHKKQIQSDIDSTL